MHVYQHKTTKVCICFDPAGSYSKPTLVYKAEPAPGGWALSLTERKDPYFEFITEDYAEMHYVPDDLAWALHRARPYQREAEPARLW